jgi:hypothetical protein
MITRRALARTGALGLAGAIAAPPHRPGGDATLAHGHLVAQASARTGDVG